MWPAGAWPAGPGVTAKESPLEKRRGSLRAIAAEVPRITAPVLGKRGFAEAQLVAQWRAIVGDELADKLAPDRLGFRGGERRNGSLRVRVASGFGPEVQHRSPLILERINAFFGYRAVERLILVQGPPVRAASAARPRPRALAAAETAALDRRLAGVEDPELRDALRRLGAAIIGTAER